MKELTTAKVFEILNASIDKAPINMDVMDKDLSELGVDSLLFIKIIVAIEEEFKCEIPDEKLLVSEMNTVNKIIRILQDLYTESVEQYKV